MSECLIALYEGHEVGTLHYRKDTLHFEYTESWQNSPIGFPVSLSMPLTTAHHKDAVVRAFIEGLLPDNASVLNAWGKRFQVSPRNPFRLLCHVGEECAGAIQFVLPDRKNIYTQSPIKTAEVDWLSDADLSERLQSLMNDHSLARQASDQGHFSLAGAQPKTALYYEEKSGRWGVPYGMTPTTHILKPNLSDYLSYELNEHFCLKLAEKVGMRVAETSLANLGGIPTIIVKRYDRVKFGQEIRRVHQEDFCQALAYRPLYKYQNEGGPTPKQIFELIRNSSSSPAEDAARFLYALILNWLIGGTDAHAKNYSFLIAGNGQVRLAPLYDISSCLPYPQSIPLSKAKLAMKVANDYHLHKITLAHWRRVAKEWGYSEAFIIDAMRQMCDRLIAQASPLAEDLSLSLELKVKPTGKNNILPALATNIIQRARQIRDQ